MLSTPCITNQWNPRGQQKSATYKGRHHTGIHLDVGFAHPVDVEVQFDAVDFTLGRLCVGKPQRHRAQIDLGEVERGQRSGEHGLEHGLHDLLDHLAAGGIDVGP